MALAMCKPRDMESHVLDMDPSDTVPANITSHHIRAMLIWFSRSNSHLPQRERERERERVFCSTSPHAPLGTFAGNRKHARWGQNSPRRFHCRLSRLCPAWLPSLAKHCPHERLSRGPAAPPRQLTRSSRWHANAILASQTRAQPLHPLHDAAKRVARPSPQRPLLSSPSASAPVSLPSSVLAVRPPPSSSPLPHPRQTPSP
mmetsp:Transcript_35159/g.83397  ORF Transcript_35159/g.83397 Transcript_35159/m.83397 type:complete len:202 (-) Transcript_35159:1253-1858(-)